MPTASAGPSGANLPGIPYLQQPDAQYVLTLALECLPPGSRLVGALAANYWLRYLRSSFVFRRPRLELAVPESVAALDTDPHRPRLGSRFSVPDLHRHGLEPYAHLRHPTTGLQVYIVEARHAGPAELVPGFTFPIEPLTHYVVTLMDEILQSQGRPILRWHAEALTELLTAILAHPNADVYSRLITDWRSRFSDQPRDLPAAVNIAAIRIFNGKLVRPVRHPGRLRQALGRGRRCPSCVRDSPQGGLTVNPTWALACQRLLRGAVLANPGAAVSTPRGAF